MKRSQTYTQGLSDMDNTTTDISIPPRKKISRRQEHSWERGLTVTGGATYKKTMADLCIFSITADLCSPSFVQNDNSNDSDDPQVEEIMDILLDSQNRRKLMSISIRNVVQTL